MKINYIAVLNPYEHGGGGEVVLKQLLESGKKRGHKIRITSLYSKRQESFSNPDLTIAADIFNTPLLFRKFTEPFLKRLFDGGKYVHFDNAYVDSCNLDYLPCSGKPTPLCSWKSPMNLKRNIRAVDFGTGCYQKRESVQKLYHNSSLNVFVSPLHRKVISSMLGLEESKGFVLRPLIDSSRFFDRKERRDIEYLFIGAIGEAKGVENLREQFSNKNLHLIGNIVKGTNLDFGTHLGTVPYEEIPHYLNRAKNFVFLPRWPEPQGRVVVEAALCGCNLITNNNVGATSFPFDIGDPKYLENAEQEFWETLEQL